MNFKPKTFKGEYAGSQYSSLYPKLFRAKYRKSIAGKAPQEIDEIITATDEYHARARCQKGDIRGSISIEFLRTLELNEA